MRKLRLDQISRFREENQEQKSKLGHRRKLGIEKKLRNNDENQKWSTNSEQRRKPGIVKKTQNREGGQKYRMNLETGRKDESIGFQLDIDCRFIGNDCLLTELDQVGLAYIDQTRLGQIRSEQIRINQITYWIRSVQVR